MTELPMAIKAIHTQREELQAQIRKLDVNERHMRIKFGLPVTRQRLTKDVVEHVRESILGMLSELPGEYFSPDEICGYVGADLEGVSDDEIKGQIRVLGNDADSHIRHNGERGRASRYVYMIDAKEELPVSDIDIERCNAWILNVAIGLSGQGQLLMRAEDIIARVKEHGAFSGLSNEELYVRIHRLARTEKSGLRSNGEMGEEERFIQA